MNYTVIKTISQRSGGRYFIPRLTNDYCTVIKVNYDVIYTKYTVVNVIKINYTIVTLQYIM